MKHLLATSITIALLSLGLAGCGEKQATKEVTSDAFVTIQGQDLIKPDGTKLFIMGTNLGNWLNPEGYMFKFNKTNSGRFINEMFCQLVGPDFTADFWKAFKDNYVTREDIRFIKEQGANTIRLPFHYKLFTDEDYMGLPGRVGPRIGLVPHPRHARRSRRTDGRQYRRQLRLSLAVRQRSQPATLL